IFEFEIDNADGDFEFELVLSGTYSVTAIKDNGAYYKYIENITIDENNKTLQFNLDDFRAFTGTISAPVNAENCVISFYKDNKLINSTLADEYGNYLMPNIIPGTYKINSNLAGNYFASSTYSVDAKNQNLDIELVEYAGNIATSFASYPKNTWDLVPNYTLSCGVKISTELDNVAVDDIIAKVRFLVPIEQTEGEIFAQLWQNETLISEVEVTEFSKNNWIEINFDKFIQVKAEYDYFVGYKINTTTGKMAFQDAGPHQKGYGAFTRTSGWRENHNATNFCIEPIIISNNYAEIDGNITWLNIEDLHANTIIKAGNIAVRPDEKGHYQLQLPAGDHTIIAKTAGATSSPIAVSVQNGEIIQNINLILAANLNSEEDISITPNKLNANYPNPFNPETTISFSTKETGKVKIDVFNSKGQKVKTLLNKNILAGEHQVIWNGRNNQNSEVTSGVYFYRMQTANFITSKKMILLK
ncbi:MAG: T9SS type A sorting domain-containing protein, partial [Candidatus Cloacimonetes bacterium]|nr:T9SS type A sorting domain-containing protein [Candidatus Cloacimonadota bacterium]